MRRCVSNDTFLVHVSYRKTVHGCCADVKMATTRNVS